MTRLNPVNRQSVTPKTAQALDGVEKALGIVPNLYATMAQSDAVINGYLSFSNSLAGGQLSGKLREEIALAVGQQNNCDYCVAAHLAIGAGAGVDEATMTATRQGRSSDPKTDAILKFATRIVSTRGNVSDDDVATLTEQGLSEGEIAEVIANVAMSIFTNYFNHIAGTEVDFPKPTELAAVGV